MNFITLMSFLGSFTVFFVSVMLAFKNPMALIDGPSLLIVIGGTLTTTLVCFSPPMILNLLRVFFRRMLGKSHIDYHAIIADIVELSKANRKGKMAFDAATKTMKHPFLKEGAEVLYWIESDISPDELRDLLETRAGTIYDVYIGDAQVFKTLGKFPPAFGMMGTTIGMIALLQDLGGSSDTLGPSMAIALITTLYGLVGSNLMIAPISENLAKQAKEDKLARTIIIEGLMLVQSMKPPQYVEEKVKSFLLPSQRPTGSGKSQDTKRAA